MKRFWLALLLSPALIAQQPPPNPLMNGAQAIEFYQRVVQVMESTTVAVPELSRSGAPLIEACRQSLTNLRINSGNAAYNYAFLTNLRAYLAVSDAVPKPYPFPAEAQRQFAELRDSAFRAEASFTALIELKDRQLRNPDPNNLARFADMDSRIGPPKAGKPRVVFLGDSITDFWRLNEYFPDRDFVNRGISGQITIQMLGRMQSDVIGLQPAAIVFHGGTNDIARGMSLNAIEDNITMIADLAETHRIKFILTSVLPVSDYHKDVNPAYEMSKNHPPVTIRALNDWIRSFCTRRNLPFVNYYSEMVDASGFLKPDLADDGLHPNPAGYRIMAPLALSAIEATTKAAPAASPSAPPKRRRLFGN